MGKNRFSVKPG